jgi:error-prone DNA polymerase
MPQYVELHARSAFSFLEGASLPETLARVCSERNMPAMALLDRDGVYGAPRFHMAAKKFRIKAHIGAEISVEGAGRLPVLVESHAGYQNLCRQITNAKLRTPKKQIAYARLEELQSHAEGLIALTGDENGPLANALEAGGIEAGRRTIETLIAAFGRRNVYIELQRHANRFQQSRNNVAVQLAQEFRLPLLATNGVCYATPAERKIADVFTCIKNKRRLATAGRLLCGNSLRHVRSAEEMSSAFADIPEAIANTQELSSRLDFTLEKLG